MGFVLVMGWFMIRVRAVILTLSVSFYVTAGFLGYLGVSGDVYANDAGSALKVEEVADGVFVHYGQPQTWNAGNAGDVANLGFVVGGKCIAVIDTGSTLQIGQRLLQAIRTVSPAPICYVVNTHAHPDHVLGNQAFVETGAKFVGHHNLSRALATKGPVYLNAMKRELAGLAQGSRLVPPTIKVETHLDLDLGGRKLSVQAWPVAHTDADVTVIDQQTRSLFLGDLSFVGHLPALDGSLLGWIATLDELAALDAQVAIPGHGAKSAGEWAGILAKQRSYLTMLRDDVRVAIRDGKSLSEAVESITTGATDGWVLYDEFHQRNVTAAYAELEWE